MVLKIQKCVRIKVNWQKKAEFIIEKRYYKYETFLETHQI